MRKLIISTMLIFMFSTLTFSQKNDSGEQKPKSDTACFDFGGTRILCLKLPKVRGINKEEDDDDTTKEDNGSRFFLMDLGLNTYLYNNSISLPKGKELLNVDLIRSRTFSLLFYKQAINLYHENLRFVFGIGLDYNNYVFDNNTQLILDKDSIRPVNDPFQKYTKSKLATIFWNAPLGIRVEGNHSKKKKGLRLEAGFNLSYFYSAHTKRTIDEKNYENQIKEWDKFHIKKIRYGPYIRAGYRSLEFFANYSLTPLFYINSGPKVLPFSFGIAINGF